MVKTEMSNQTKKIIFYYLSAFRYTGGIEKFNRCFIKALAELENKNLHSEVVSVYDNEADEKYRGKQVSFKGFDKKRGPSVFYIIRRALKSDVLIIGHINLAVAGVIIKTLKPRCRLVVVAHGTEVWDKMYLFKKWLLRKADIILSVSNYTKNQLVLRNKISPSRIRLFPNTIDPYFHVPREFEKPDYLLKRYDLKKDQQVILTLSRLSNSEQYKGYDKVIASLKAILIEFPDAVYILAGKYDEKEKLRIDKLLHQYQITENVIVPGFISEKEVTDHYKLADVFIMPSRKEGFGIVFLEALASGTPVIGGNQDGTVDALYNGSLGKLINPTKVEEISNSLIQQLRNPNSTKKIVQEKVLNHYEFSRYKERLNKYLLEL